MATHVERVIVFGDSFTFGLGATDGGWTEKLEKHYRDVNGGPQISKRPRIFYNLGVYAARAADVAAITRPMDKRLWIPDEPEGAYDPGKRLFIVAAGTNDSWLKTDGTYVTPMDSYQESTTDIATTLRSLGKILCLGLFPCDEKKCGTFWGVETPAQFESRLRYETVMLEIFKEAGATTVPLVQEASASAEYMKSISRDGVHVGERGETWLYNSIVPYFDELLGIDPELRIPGAQ